MMLCKQFNYLQPWEVDVGLELAESTHFSHRQQRLQGDGRGMAPVVSNGERDSPILSNANWVTSSVSNKGMHSCISHDLR